jgi:hypothetical protein
MPISSETRVYVVFDRATGEVVHVHETVVFPNTPQGRESPDARALRLAGATGSENLDVVEVDPGPDRRARADDVQGGGSRRPSGGDADTARFPAGSPRSLSDRTPKADLALHHVRRNTNALRNVDRAHETCLLANPHNIKTTGAGRL